VLGAAALAALAACELLARALHPQPLLGPARFLPAMRASPAELAEAARDRRAFKVVGLGDSIMYGSGLAREQTYLELLGPRLQAALRRPVRVLNLAVPAFNTVQESAALRELGLAVGPDLVIVHFWEDDVREYPFAAAAGRLWELRPGMSDEVLAALPLPGPVRRPLLRHSRAFQLLSWAAWALRARGSAGRAGQAWPQALASIQDAAARSGARVLLLLSPRLEQGPLGPARGELYARVRLWAEGLGMEVMDLGEALRGRPGRDVGLDDCHFNALGQRLVAEALAARLLGPAGAARRRKSPRS